jgi:hypothetical protein
MVVIDLFYMMMVFGFDCNLAGENKKTDLKKMVDLFASWEQTKMQTQVDSHPV